LVWPKNPVSVKFVEPAHTCQAAPFDSFTMNLLCGILVRVRSNKIDFWKTCLADRLPIGGDAMMDDLNVDPAIMGAL
jgi:hypothetical protein